ncbi:hypothetical protein ACGFJC_26330 [Nonomuraea fuscirosea]|uniref:hypothetical protein n=1 Tax=Nonomuraea fuscirosea TaxID=1291556 RepID=UPI003716B4AC
MLDHYRALFRRYPWLADSACWTVVQPFDDELTPDDLLWRLNGGRDPEERTLDHPMETVLDELDDLDPEDFDGRRATALAFIEAATGVGIEIDRLDGEQTTVIVLDDPVN